MVESPYSGPGAHPVGASAPGPARRRPRPPSRGQWSGLSPRSPGAGRGSPDGLKLDERGSARRVNRRWAQIHFWTYSRSRLHGRHLTIERCHARAIGADLLLDQAACLTGAGALTELAIQTAIFFGAPGQPRCRAASDRFGPQLPPGSAARLPQGVGVPAELGGEIRVGGQAIAALTAFFPGRRSSL